MQIEEREQGPAVASEGENVEQTTSIEWARNVQTIELSPEVLAEVHELLEAAPRPCLRLREAAKRQRQQR
jgi:hypothetical protein